MFSIKKLVTFVLLSTAFVAAQGSCCGCMGSCSCAPRHTRVQKTAKKKVKMVTNNGKKAKKAIRRSFGCNGGCCSCCR